MEWILENQSIFWFILLIVFLALEGLNAALITIWFAGGALIALLVSFFIQNIFVTTGIFVVSSALLLIFTKPLLQNRMKYKKIRTNADSVIGETGIMTKTADEFNVGQAKVKGQIWTVSPENEETITKGSVIHVVSISGVKLLVRKEHQESEIEKESLC